MKMYNVHLDKTEISSISGHSQTTDRYIMFLLWCTFLYTPLTYLIGHPHCPFNFCLTTNRRQFFKMIFQSVLFFVFDDFGFITLYCSLPCRLLFMMYWIRKIYITRWIFLVFNLLIPGFLLCILLPWKPW